jgi:hypothetical protein
MVPPAMLLTLGVAVLPIVAGLAAASEGAGAVLAAVEAAEKRRPTGDAVQPEIVVPGGWLTDNVAKFLFLPLEVPKDIGKSCKIMSNGDSILVVVTERPEEEPETNAMKKYKLVIEAIKTETRNDEHKLKSKLQAWLDTEEDDEVRVHIRAALDSLVRVRKAKKNFDPRVVSVPLGFLQAGRQPARRLTDGSSKPGASRSLLVRRKAEQITARTLGETRIIKESFAVVIPYAAPVEEIFVLTPDPGLLMVGMPLQKHSLDAKGISTGGKPFVRLPVFGGHGEKLWGEGPAKLARMAKGLNLHALTAPNGLIPLE